MPSILRKALLLIVGAVLLRYVLRQCRRPTGLLGRFLVRAMNVSHGPLTAWGLQHVEVGKHDTVLDVGCGGGRTVQRLAGMAELGKVVGVDYSAASVASARAFNRDGVAAARVEIREGSVSQLPFADDAFDLVTAVETHYYWPDRPGDVREIRRVLKPGGKLLMLAESYGGSRFDLAFRGIMGAIGGQSLTADEHRELLANAGYEDVQVFLEPAKGWICATGRKPPRSALILTSNS